MSRSIPMQTPTGTPAVIAAPADGSDNLNTDVSALLAEVAALRQRLAALEERPQGNPPKGAPGRQAKPRTARKTVAWLTTGAVLAMLAGVSVVYGQSAVDAFFISKEGDVAIGPSGALFVGKAGNVAIGPSRLDPTYNYKLHVSTSQAKTSTNVGYGLAVTTTDAVNPFGLGVRLIGAPALADRSAVLLTTDVNLADGGRLVLQPSSGNVGIGTYTPKADNKLEVNGKIAATSLDVDSATIQKSVTALGALTVEKDATLKGPMKIEGKNMLEFGAGVSDKQGDAGKIGYQVWDDALDIVGAGAKVGNPLPRKITFWAEGGATFTGNLNVSGTVVGNIKTRLQVNNDAETTLTKPNWRYHITLTGGDRGSKTRTIPRDVLIALCGPPDGCNGVLGRRLWSANETMSWSNTFHFIYNKDTQGFRSDAPFGSDGSTINGQNLDYVANAGSRGGGFCYITPETWENGQNKGNRGDGLQLRIDGADRAERECNLTLIP